jgi:hypothetical protein
MAWGGGGPAAEVLGAGRGSKAARERRRPWVAVAGGSAGADGGGERVFSGGVAALRSCFPSSSPAVRCSLSTFLSNGSLLLPSTTPTRSDSKRHPVGCRKFDRAHGCP